MTKDRVLDSLADLPEEFSVEDLIERLLFVQKVEEGLRQSERGETTPVEDVRQQLRKWSA